MPIKQPLACKMKGARSDPTNYRPIAVLPTLSRVFEQLLVGQLQHHIFPHIPPEQFGFLRGSSTSDAGISLASTIAAAINQRADVRLVALDIKGAFDHVRWDGVLEHLRSIGCRGRMFRLFQSYLSNRFIRVVTPSDSSNLYPISAGVPQGAIWSPLLFNLYIRLLPTVVKHSLVIGYADDHTLLMTVPHKNARIAATNNLNADLSALCAFGHPWNILFAPEKTFSLLISLKCDVSSHPPLFLNSIRIPEVTSVKVLGFVFDSLFTWQKHIDGILSRAKQRLGQLYRCRSLFNCQDVFFLYKSWIRPALEYGSILYSSAASSHLNRLNSLQSRVENMCGFSISTLASRRNASILGFTCRLLNGEGRGNLQSFCPSFQKEILRSSRRLHGSDPASHLRFYNPLNFRTLDRFRRSWQITVVDLWNSIPADLLLKGEKEGWRTVLKDIQSFICTRP